MHRTGSASNSRPTSAVKAAQLQQQQSGYGSSSALSKASRDDAGSRQGLGSRGGSSTNLGATYSARDYDDSSRPQSQSQHYRASQPASRASERPSDGYDRYSDSRPQSASRVSQVASKTSMRSAQDDVSAASSKAYLGELIPCGVCGRRFNPTVLERHEPVCSKVAAKKRKVFDSAKHRLAGTDAEKFVAKPESAATVAASAKRNADKGIRVGGSAAGKKGGDWRRKHEEFIRLVRSARQATAIVKAGGNLADLPPPPPSENPDYVQCPYCERRFNESAADRHIPFCKEQSSRVPRNTPAKAQKERVEKQKAYGKVSKPSSASAGGATGGAVSSASAGNLGSQPSSRKPSAGDAKSATTGRANGTTKPLSATSGGSSDSPRGSAMEKTVTVRSAGGAARKQEDQRPIKPSSADIYYQAAMDAGAENVRPPAGRGGQTPSKPAQSQSSGISVSGVAAGGGAKGRGRFCFECGSQYPVDSAKFCSDCGTKRL